MRPSSKAIPKVAKIAQEVQHAVEKKRSLIRFEAEIRRRQHEYAALGPDDSKADMKTFFDEMWRSD